MRSPVTVEVQHAQQQTVQISRESCDLVVLSSQAQQQRTCLHFSHFQLRKVASNCVDTAGNGSGSGSDKRVPGIRHRQNWSAMLQMVHDGSLGMHLL